MDLLLAYACTLFVAVLISCRARESVLSTSVLFLAVGLVLGKRPFGFHVPPQELLFRLADLALFSVLYTSGMKTGGLQALRRSWRMPSRALFAGMPLTIAGAALIAHWMLSLSWVGAILIGSALSPTDPIFISGVFRVEAIPERVKHILNVESGFNDGLALPPLLITLALLTGNANRAVVSTVSDLALGLLIGIAIPWTGIRLERSRFFGAAGIFQRLNAFALGLLAVAEAVHANIFFAAFAAGITTATFSEAVTKAFHDFGDQVTELLKLAVLLVFGARVAPVLFAVAPATVYIFAVLAVFAVRPVAIWLSLWRSGLPLREKTMIGIFGPKGFASLVYALMILHSGGAESHQIARTVGLAVTFSIVFFSSTDVFFGRWFGTNQKRPEHRKQPNAA
ncbi:MAG TPA: cation:proton antiporter [Terriglobales bacterium]|nr:cation:proton antiporter [Terriglobales bacterium]